MVYTVLMHLSLLVIPIIKWLYSNGCTSVQPRMVFSVLHHFLRTQNKNVECYGYMDNFGKQ